MQQLSEEKGVPTYYAGHIYLNHDDRIPGTKYYTEYLMTLVKYPVHGSHSFKDGEDVTGKYELKKQGLSTLYKWVDIPDDVYDELDDTSRRIVALPLPEREPAQEGKNVYFIEDRRNGKWLKMPQSFDDLIIDTSRSTEDEENRKWTTDPHQAMQWKTFEEAEAHNKKYWDMVDIEVTEHQFISLLTQEQNVEDVVYCGNCGKDYNSCNCDMWHPIYGQHIPTPAQQGEAERKEPTDKEMIHQIRREIDFLKDRVAYCEKLLGCDPK